MEIVLFLLFLLFSMFSALMERRKRRKQLEEAAQQQEAISERQDQAEESEARAPVVEEQKEEPSFGWPFEGDPFEDFKPAAKEAEPDSSKEEGLEPVVESELVVPAVDDRALEMERWRQETRAQKSEEVQRRKSRKRSRAGRRARVGHWALNPQKARDAVVYMEILGKPKSEREDF